MRKTNLCLHVNNNMQVNIGDDITLEFYRDELGGKKVRITCPVDKKITRVKDNEDSVNNRIRVWRREVTNEQNTGQESVSNKQPRSE